MSPSDASGSSETTIASWWALMTQIDWAGLAPTSRAIVGRAMLTIELSSTDTARPMTMVRIAQ
jgi:hypothetical protein